MLSRLPVAERYELLCLYREGGTNAIAEHAARLGYKKAQHLSRQLQAANLYHSLMGPEEHPAPLADAWEAYIAGFNQWMLQPPDLPKPHPPIDLDANEILIAIVCDGHGHFRSDIIDAVCELRPHITIFGGDSLNNDRYSQHKKRRRLAPLDLELNRTKADIWRSADASRWYAVLVYGNHCIRRALFYASLFQGYDWAFDDLQPDPFQVWASETDKIRAVRNVHLMITAAGNPTDDEMHDLFTFRHGDLVVGHPSIARKAPGSSVSAFRAWYNMWAPRWGEELPGWVVMGHTHKASINYRDREVEGGFAGHADDLQYILDGHAKSQQGPPVEGFTTVVQYKEGDQWVTDSKQVQFHLC